MVSRKFVNCDSNFSFSPNFSPNVLFLTLRQKSALGPWKFASGSQNGTSGTHEQSIAAKMKVNTVTWLGLGLL